MENNGSEIFQYLITNKGFRDWVKKPNELNNYFWMKWMEEHPENIRDVKKAREFIERLRFKQEKLSEHQLDDLLGKIIKNERTAPLPVSKEREPEVFRMAHWLRVAAVLVICLIGAVILANLTVPNVHEDSAPVITEWKTVKNPRGRKSKITLPDGTHVNLNYESQLKFPVVFESNVRKVELIGEAFFEVAHNDTLPFIVQTGTIETEVLGTSFNISSFEWENDTDVSLVTGKVKIIWNKGVSEEDIYLSPGEQLTFNRNSQKIAIKNFDVANTLAWRDGIILFKDAGLDEYVDQLERWYGVSFQVYGKPSKVWNINGRYENESLNNILLGLKFVYDIEYKIQGKNITLKLK